MYIYMYMYAYTDSMQSSSEPLLIDWDAPIAGQENQSAFEQPLMPTIMQQPIIQAQPIMVHQQQQPQIPSYHTQQQLNTGIAPLDFGNISYIRYIHQYIQLI